MLGKSAIAYTYSIIVYGEHQQSISIQLITLFTDSSTDVLLTILYTQNQPNYIETMVVRLVTYT